MPSPFQLRNALPNELDQAAEVIRAAYAEYSTAVPKHEWEEYSRNIVDVRSRLSESELIVAVRDKSVVGTVTLYPDGASSGGEEWPRGWTGIRLLATHPDYRGQGIARALMDECLRRSRKLGARTVGLHTTAHMAVARSMYERMGFVRVPEFDFTPSRDVVVVAYRLNL